MIMDISDEIRYLWGEFRPFILDLISLYILHHRPKRALVELLRPMRQANPILERSQPLLSNLLGGVYLRHHCHCHSQAD
jgi:hypothetical protein